MYDIAIIGSGPGGYVAAIRAKQLNLNVVVIEQDNLGGTCLNWGCIPTKALLKSASVLKNNKDAANFGIMNSTGEPDFSAIIKRSRGVADQMNKGINFLFKKNKIDVVEGRGKILDSNSIEVTNKNNETSIVKAKNIIIATGAHAKDLPTIKKDGKKIIGYKEAMSLESQPESMLIVGSGAIGTEFAYFYNTIGTKVTLVEFMPDLLPLEDSEITKLLSREFKKSKMKVMLSSTVQSVDTKGDKCIVKIETTKGVEEIETDIVLLAAGVETNIDNIGLENVGIETEKRKIIVDNNYKTSVDNIYAIGDVVKGQALAHVASAEGIHAVEFIAGLKPEPVNYNNVPSCVYCNPEVASVGLSEAKAIEAGYEIKIGRFPFTASGKATASDHKEGMIKIIADAKNDKVLGAHMLGENVTEMISEIALAIKLNASLHDITTTIHPHPTMSEAIMEAAEEADNKCIHL